MAESTPAHEYAEIFPLHEGARLMELADRIKANGLREPIVLLHNKILDGRRRELACFVAEVKPHYREFGSRKTDGTDPLEFVYDTNFHRREMTEGERKLAAAKYAKACEGRPSKNGAEESVEGKTAPNTGKTQEKKPAQLEQVSTNKEAARKHGVSEQDVRRAKTVEEHGTKELKKALADDAVTVSDAAKIAKEPEHVQKAAVAAVLAGETKSLAGFVEQAKSREPGDDTPDMKDAVGHAVPEDCAPAFKTVEKFEEMDGLCQKLQKLISESAQQPGGEQLARCLQATKSGENTIHKHEALNTLKRDLKGYRPYSVCPWCAGKGRKGCKGCSGTGWVTKTCYDNAEDSIKEKLK
jgi:hypothetical protein